MTDRLRYFTAKVSAGLAALVVAASALASSGCSTQPTGTNGNANSNLNANTSAANLNTNSSAAGTGTLATREPENYSATMTISAQGEASNRQGGGTLQVEFARLGADRRWAFKIPQPVGEVIYLEKAGLKYLVLPARSQYVEVSPEELGFELGKLMTPATMVEQLKTRTQFENLGTEAVNGRTAIKYRFRGAADTRTQAGTAEADSFVYVDESTGLPLRSDVSITTTRGDNARIMIETRDIQLSPQATLFDVPVGMKKVTGQELKQQVQGFVNAIQIFAAMMRQAGGAATPPPGPAQPAANTNTNMNANRP